MKKLFLFLVVISALWQCAWAEDLPDTVWSKNFGGADNYISDCKFTPDGQKIIVAAGTSVYVLETLTSKVLHVFTGFVNGGNKVYISKDGNYLYAKSLIKYDLNTYRAIDTLKSLGQKNITIGEFCLSPNDEYLVYSGHVYGKPVVDSNLVIVSTENMEIIKIISLTNISLGKNLYSPDSENFILQMGKDLTLWDAKTYTYIKTIYTDSNPINDIKFSPNGKMLGISVGGHLKVFETENFNIIKSINGTDDNGIYRIVFSPNSNYIIYGQGGFNNASTKIINVNSWNLSHIYTAPYCAGTGIDVSKNSEFILIARGPNLYLLNSFGGITGAIELKQLSFYIKTRTNPTNKDLIIDFSIPDAGKSLITLNDLLGNVIKNIYNGYLESGIHSMTFETYSFSSGIYILKLETNGKTVSQKIIINN
jgi:hypothetical protein